MENNNTFINNDPMLAKYMFENDMSAIISGYSVEVASRVIDQIQNNTNPEYGAKGDYSFFCTHCGTSFSFDSKEEMELVKRIHKKFGCDFTFVVETSKKKKHNNKQFTFMRRTNKIINAYWNEYAKDFKLILTEQPES